MQPHWWLDWAVAVAPKPARWVECVVGQQLPALIGYERDVHGRPAGFRRTGASIQGLTTAAGLWLVAAIGLASGAAEAR